VFSQTCKNQNRGGGRVQLQYVLFHNMYIIDSMCDVLGILCTVFLTFYGCICTLFDALVCQDFNDLIDSYNLGSHSINLVFDHSTTSYVIVYTYHSMLSYFGILLGANYQFKMKISTFLVIGIRFICVVWGQELG